MALANVCYSLTGEFPKTERYGLSSQIQRAAVSVASNIAEGSSRNSDKKFGRFLRIALGSAYELETQLEIASTAGYVSEANANLCRVSVIKVQRMLYSLITSKTEQPR